METSNSKRFWFGVYLFLLSIAIACCLVLLWYAPSTDLAQGKTIWSQKASLAGLEWKGQRVEVGYELRFILLVIFAGALGSCIHVATSFATYVGNKSLVDTWYWWYFLRTMIGVALSLIFYFAIRGGLLLVTGSAGDTSLNPFGIAAVAGLVGMFSKQASDKLSEVFDTLFKSANGDEARANKLGEMRPVADYMLGINKIVGVELKNGKTEDNVTIKELHDLLKGAVTRIPIFTDQGAAEYVIHQSMLFKFISKKSMEAAGAPIDVSTMTLSDFLAFENMSKIVKDSLAFVPENATLGDAKRQMDQTENCQDVFVTKDGTKAGKVIGWVTNIDIIKHIKA